MRLAPEVVRGRSKMVKEGATVPKTLSAGDVGDKGALARQVLVQLCRRQAGKVEAAAELGAGEEKIRRRRIEGGADSC